MLHKDCPNCTQPMSEVLHAARNIRRGWYCAPCKVFERAMFRERVIEKSHATERGDKHDQHNQTHRA